MKIAIYGLKAELTQKKSFVDFFNELSKRNIHYTIEKEFKNILEKKLALSLKYDETFSSYEDLQEDVQLFFTFGGDGTILSAATVIQNKNIPIVGVNTGRLGFLATINIEYLFDSLEGILNGNYKISKRSLIEVHSNQVKIEFPFALNEVAVTRRETTSMITIDVSLNGEFLNSYWADGLIVSTPTGSTGYSLSCGGPIIHPENKNFVVTAIAPHNLNIRPFIISDDSILELNIKSREKKYFLSMDSRNKPLPTRVKLQLKKSDFQLFIIEPEEKTYLITLRDKMFWGSDKRN
ncbi:MAG: NAD kinase [Weeksellaceae bacterium]|jgi:NAD+ kinase|nr:NAD kinase [Weeksellaceae bacterium]